MFGTAWGEQTNYLVTYLRKQACTDFVSGVNLILKMGDCEFHGLAGEGLMLISSRVVVKGDYEYVVYLRFHPQPQFVGEFGCESLMSSDRCGYATP